MLKLTEYTFLMALDQAKNEENSLSKDQDYIDNGKITIGILDYPFF